MPLSPGIPLLGSVRQSQRVHGVSSGGVILPPRSLPGGGGFLSDENAIKEPVLRYFQHFVASPWKTPAANVKYFEGCISYAFKYLELTKAMFSSAYNYYVLVNMLVESLRLVRYQYIGPPPASEEDEKAKLGIAQYWMPEWGVGLPPELVVAWAPFPPLRYAGSMRTAVFEGFTEFEKEQWEKAVGEPENVEIQNQGIDPFLTYGEKKYIVPRGFVSVPLILQLQGSGNYMPKIPAEPQWASVQGTKELQEYRAAFAALPPPDQEKALKELGEQHAEEVKTLEKEEHEFHKKVEEEKGYPIIFPKNPFPLAQKAERWIREVGTDSKGNLTYGAPRRFFRFSLRNVPGLGDLKKLFLENKEKGYLMIGFQLPPGSLWGDAVSIPERFAPPGAARLERFGGHSSPDAGSVALGTSQIGSVSA